jgi:hypothetical protein
MSAARDVEGEPAEPKLAAKLAAHPSVQAVLARRRAGEVAKPPAVIDADCASRRAPTMRPRSTWTIPTWPASASTCWPRCPAPAP